MPYNEALPGGPVKDGACVIFAVIDMLCIITDSILRCCSETQKDVERGHEWSSFGPGLDWTKTLSHVDLDLMLKQFHI